MSGPQPSSALALDTQILNQYERSALIEASNDHIMCQIDSLQARLDSGGELLASDILPKIREFYTRKELVDTGNESSDSVTLQFSGQYVALPAAKQVAMASEANQLQKFTCFKDLSPELRDKIWAHALPDSQVIEVFRTRTNLINYRMPAAACKTLMSLLLTSRDANHLVKLYYKYIDLNHGSPTVSPAYSMLLSPKNDVLYFTGADQILLNMTSFPNTHQAGHFNTLAMPAAILKFYLHREDINSFTSWLTHLRCLKTLLVITQETQEQRHQQLAFSPYKGADCRFMKNLAQLWKDVTKKLGLEIELIWVNPLRDGKLAMGVFHAH